VCEKKGRGKEALQIWETIWQQLICDGRIPEEAIKPGLEPNDAVKMLGQLAAVCEETRPEETLKVWNTIWQKHDSRALQ
jgi:hypothetical protein